jgi:Transmembrane secretion effector
MLVRLTSDYCTPSWVLAHWSPELSSFRGDARAPRYSPNTLTRRAAYLLAVVILLIAFVRQTQLLLLVAALAGVAWTSTANELWVAGQRATPVWARGRMNATIIMFSQGAMALGGVRNNRTDIRRHRR